MKKVRAFCLAWAVAVPAYLGAYLLLIALLRLSTDGLAQVLMEHGLLLGALSAISAVVPAVMYVFSRKREFDHGR